MPQMNFDLEDGKEPVSFSLTAADADRFQAFMAECNGYLNRAERLEKLHSVERDRADALLVHVHELHGALTGKGDPEQRYMRAYAIASDGHETSLVQRDAHMKFLGAVAVARLIGELEDKAGGGHDEGAWRALRSARELSGALAEEYRHQAEGIAAEGTDG